MVICYAFVRPRFRTVPTPIEAMTFYSRPRYVGRLGRIEPLALVRASVDRFSGNRDATPYPRL